MDDQKKNARIDLQTHKKTRKNLISLVIDL